MNTLASLNPFFDSELAPAMGDPGSATAPDLSDPPVAVVANSFAPSLPAERAGVAAGQIPAPGPVPAVTSNSACEPAPMAPATSMPGVETTAGDTGENIVSSPAAFSLDLRIHNIMLAVADELADEQRTINERLLLRQFARQA